MRRRARIQGRKTSSRRSVGRLSTSLSRLGLVWIAYHLKPGSICSASCALGIPATPARFVRENSDARRSVTNKSLDSNRQLFFFACRICPSVKFLDIGGDLRCNEAVVAVN